MNQQTTLTENDRAELHRFRLYLAACRRWDDENEEPVRPPDHELMIYMKKRMKAHGEIYEQMYGEKL